MSTDSQENAGVAVDDEAGAELMSLLEHQRSALRARGEPSSPEHRRSMLNRLQVALLERRLQIADAINEDFGGRPRAESLLELSFVIEDLRHAQAHLGRWMKSRRVATNWQFLPSRSQLLPQPLGVVGVIGSYNYPVMTTLSPAVGAIAAGNHVLLKPSSMTPRCSELIQKLIADTYDPSEVAVVLGGSTVAKQFSKLPFDHLVFTGSTRVGKLIMRDAAENLVPVTLELGGKSPAIVDPRFDLKTAAETIVLAKFLNAGQTCVTSDYALVAEPQLDAFLEQLRVAIRRFYPSLSDPKGYGRVLQRNDWSRLSEWVGKAHDGGAQVEVINPRNESCTQDNRIFAPTIVSRFSSDVDLAREEIFGPVLPVMTYKSIDEAIAHVNAGERPLALYLFSHDKKIIDKVLRRTISGGVTINACGYHAIQHNLPFGGVGASGIGSYHGRAGFDRFSHLKPVLHVSRLVKVNALLQPPAGKLAAWTLGFMLHNRPHKEEL